MPRQTSFRMLLVLTLLWIVITGITAYSKIGSPLRWVDVFIIFAFSFLAGTYYQRAMFARRGTATTPPEIPGGPPSVPK